MRAIANGMGFSSWDDEDVLVKVLVMAAQLCEYTRNL